MPFSKVNPKQPVFLTSALCQFSKMQISCKAYRLLKLVSFSIHYKIFFQKNNVAKIFKIPIFRKNSKQ